MGLQGSASSDDGFVSGTDRKNEKKLKVIDVDALDGGEDASSLGKGVVDALRQATEPIDVDNPTTWAVTASSSGAGPAHVVPSPPLLKFRGALGVALFEQKMEVLEEEADAARALTVSDMPASIGKGGGMAVSVDAGGDLVASVGKGGSIDVSVDGAGDMEASVGKGGGAAVGDVATVDQAVSFGEGGAASVDKAASVCAGGGASADKAASVGDGGGVSTDEAVGIVASVGRGGVVSTGETPPARKASTGRKTRPDGKVLFSSNAAPVDNASLAGNAPPAVGASSAGGVASVGGALSSDVVQPTGRQATLAESTEAVRTGVMARMQAASRERDAVVAAVVSARDAQLQMPWPPAGSSLAPSSEEQAATPSKSSIVSVADLSGHARPSTGVPMEWGTPRTMAMPPPQRSLFHTDNNRSVPLVPGWGFVRKAPVMQVARPHVDPATPPHASASGGLVDGDEADDEQECGGGSGGVLSVDDVEAADATMATTKDSAAVAIAPAVATNNDGQHVEEEEPAVAVNLAPARSPPNLVSGAANHPVPSSSGAESVAVDAARVHPSSILGKRSVPSDDEEEGAASTASPAVRGYNETNELAEHLAARSRNPHVFPAAFWFPHAQAVLAASQRSPVGHGLPPVAPSVLHDLRRVGATVFAASSRAATPLPPPPCRSPAQQTAEPARASRHDEEGSSSDMDDDALVAAYITPPASPTASPGNNRLSSGLRRRYSAARAPRAAAAAATPASQGDRDPAVVSLFDLLHAVRTGFSSVRRELTRLRAEVVVVKSQSASALRRMDGIAAASDGSNSGNAVVLERLTRLESVVTTLGDRLPSARTVNGDADATDPSSPTVIRDIKVSSRMALVFWTQWVVVTT